MDASELRIGFDPGSSLTKVIYSVNRGEPKILMMEPDVISLPASSIASLTKSSTVNPEDRAWIKLKRNSEEVQVCGFLAREYLAVERVEMLKYEHAFYKFLAAVGAIAIKEGINEFSIKASFLLPYGEINSRKWLEESLTKSVKRFYFQNDLIRAKLDGFLCSVEGAGMVWDVINSHELDWFNRHRVVILMFGYRNLSCLSFHRGVIESRASATSDLGFIKLIDKIIARTSGQDRKTLTEAVYKIGADINFKNEILRALTKSTQPEFVEQEISSLVDTIALCRKEYWISVRDWLDSVLPTQVDLVMISGGTGVYLKNELDQHLAWAEPIWLGEKAMGVVNLTDPTLRYRFADIVSLFCSTLFESRSAA